ncbi:GATA transcription factor 7-like [Zingiber officinale]|uniref:GATA-type domain-containing protein n=1 Tax=Zingiber officinale TaxID=94328 RepID=A0A8J5L4I6_ZINOF|nr:GATA transcription factor 7-like [Zingiber officinale]KAG6505629.1 hypothetical protein ZIOFF_037994 [Zingiber officinale]
MSDLFDQIDDLLDFLNEEEENALVMVKKPCNETGAFLLPPLTPPHPTASASTAAAGDETLESSGNQKQFDEELDYWTPAFLDECDSLLADIELPGAAKIDAFFRDSSPISVLAPAANCNGESSSSSSYSSTSASHSGGRSFPARARSNPRRRRPTAFHLPPPRSHSTSESSESSPAPQKKKIKFTTKSLAAGTEEETRSAPPAAVRKCTHCGIQKTPQWRAGPTGPKTLCNACGVRYKTGRLFPEYRPAASPTFVPALHSNSHKKVVEMRMKAVDESATPSSGTGPDDGCDLLQYIRRRHYRHK